MGVFCVLLSIVLLSLRIAVNCLKLCDSECGLPNCYCNETRIPIDLPLYQTPQVNFPTIIKNHCIQTKSTIYICIYILLIQIQLYYLNVYLSKPYYANYIIKVQLLHRLKCIDL